MASAALNYEPSVAEEIDMERVVTDAEYRRHVITRLRRHRLVADALRGTSDDLLDAALGEED
jgi:hypothetical protein